MRDLHKAMLNRRSFVIDPYFSSANLEDALELKEAGLLQEEDVDGRRIFSKTEAGYASYPYE